MSKPELRLVPSPQDAQESMLPSQAEMPFAVVQGEPLTQLPRDLYIPPQALEVFLEAFEGPLDLLLYLIRKQNLDILDIPLADITRQYMNYIELMQDLQLELAGEYMLMAATLAEIKSRMLLPRSSDATLDESDPRADLVRRLQEYERFKQAAESIDRLPREERDTWPASAATDVRRSAATLPTVTLQEMIMAFREVVSRAAMFQHHHVQRERLSVRARMADVLAAIDGGHFVEFKTLFRAEEGRMGVTVTFVAILELVREGLLDLVQTEVYGPLHVRSAQSPHLRLVDGAPVDTGGAVAMQIDAGDAVSTDTLVSDEELFGVEDGDDEGADEPGDEIIPGDKDSQ
jgi:segregation and condensation protein A